MNTPIQLDLRRDLPKVRAAYDELIERLGACLYSAPCAIGAMMTAEQRASLGITFDSSPVRRLAEDHRRVAVPDGQLADFAKLQRAFDGTELPSQVAHDTHAQNFADTLAELEAKYASEQAAS